MEKKKAKKHGEMAIEISPMVEGGVYSNIANIIHNKNEFIIDFAMVLPGKDAARVQSRVITNPTHAKQLLMALSDNIGKYERNHGKIAIEPPPLLSGPHGSVH